MTNSGTRENISYGRLVRICGLFAASAGVIALLGWGLGLLFLASLGSGKIPMPPSTALLFVLYGAATVLRARLPLHRGAYWLGAVVHGAGALAALLLFCLSYQGIYLEVEHLGFAAVGAVGGAPIGHMSVGGAPIGHMSPVTALGFLLASLSFLASLPPVSNRRWRARMAYCFAGLLLAACSVLLLAYLYGTPLLYGSPFVPPAATTSLAFAALGIALVALAGPQAWPSGGEPGAAATRPAPVLFLAFFLLAVGIITAGHLHFGSYAAHYRTAVERELSSVTELKVDQLVQYRKERLGDGSMISHNAAVAALVRRMFDNPADDEAPAQLRAWLHSIEAHQQYSRLFLLDAQGAVRMSVPESLAPIASVVARRAAEAQRSGEMAFQDFYRDEHDQRIYLTVLVPIVGAPHSGRTLGVLALLIDPEEYLYPLISRWPRPSETAETLLIRRDGNDVLVLNELTFQKNTALTVRIPLERRDVAAVKAILGEKGVVNAVDYRGVTVIADVRAVPDSPWFLVSRIDASEVKAPLRERMWVMVALIGALLAAAGLGVASVFGQQQASFYRERFEAERDRAWLRDVIERSLNEIYVFDPKTLRFSFANTGACRNIGYTAEELARLTPLDIAPEFTEETFCAMLQPLRAGEREALVFETVGRRKDGTEYPVEVHLQHVEAGDGPVFLAIVSDITERKQAEEELALRDAALTASANAVMITDREGRIVWVNPAFTKLTGYTSEEAIGRATAKTIPRVGAAATGYTSEEASGRAQVALRALHARNAVRGYTSEEAIGRAQRMLESWVHDQSLYERMWETISSGQVWSGEVVNRRKDGTLYNEEMTITPVPLGSHFIAIKQDITSRKQAEEELALRGAALTASANAIMITDREGTIVWVNPAFTKLTGYTSEEAIGRAQRMLKSGVHDQSFYERMWETISSGQVWSGEVVSRRKDGTLYNEEMTITPVPLGSHFIAIKQDITSRKQAEQDLRQALANAEESDRLKSAFLANMGHEVRTPLNVITGYASLIEEHLQEIGDHSQDELFDGVRRGSKRLINTIHGVLDLSRIESRTFYPEPKRVELSSFLQEQIDRFTPAARSKGLWLELETEDSGAAVTFDPYCLTRVVENLLDNAVKFTAQGGVTVRIHRDEGGALCLSVSDTGVGIDPSYAPRLFERFSQEDSGFTRPFEGAGIGLALVKRFVEMNQAEISFRTEKGAGTTFTIRFAFGASAVAPGLAASATLLPSVASATATQRPIVLVVEDDDLTQGLMAAILRGDFDVLRAVSAKEARAHLAAHSEVAVVLMDLSLRGNEDGLMLTRWMRSELRWRDLPIIATTAHAMAGDRENALEAGCTVYLAKPVSPAELLSVLRRVLHRGAAAGQGGATSQ